MDPPALENAKSAAQFLMDLWPLLDLELAFTPSGWKEVERMIKFFNPRFKTSVG